MKKIHEFQNKLQYLADNIQHKYNWRHADIKCSIPIMDPYYDNENNYVSKCSFTITYSDDENYIIRIESLLRSLLNDDNIITIETDYDWDKRNYRYYRYKDSIKLQVLNRKKLKFPLTYAELELLLKLQ